MDPGYSTEGGADGPCWGEVMVGIKDGKVTGDAFEGPITGNIGRRPYGVTHGEDITGPRTTSRSPRWESVIFCWSLCCLLHL